jgi:predicted ATPase
MAEAINLLWDEGVLAAGEAGHWSLTRSLSPGGLPPADFEEMIRLRIRRLPTSTRRLASLAAVMGHCFEVHLLQEAADEHAVVVEIGLELLLERWLIRQFAHSWTSTRRERDIVLWARGARRGSFEFSHKRIRSALCGELNPLRRQAMHGQAAEALERLRGGRDAEALAYHWVAAGEWERALAPLEAAMERALSVLAWGTAQQYYEQILEALDRLAATARNDAQAERWRGERERMREVRERMAGASG